MKEYNNESVIVSLTSHHARLKHVSKTIFSILNGTFKSVHVVLTIYKDDIFNISNDLKLFIDNNIIELIIADENLRPHLKYYYVMKKYKDVSVPIITIDDDGLYHKDLVESLYTAYLNNKSSIHARRVHQVMLDQNKKSVLPYNKWKWEIVNNTVPDKYKFATGVGGVLYPPNILDIDKISITEIKKCLCADDIYLKVIENRKNIKINIVKCSGKHPISLKIKEVLNTALCKDNVSNKRNDAYIKQFSKYFL